MKKEIKTFDVWQFGEDKNNLLLVDGSYVLNGSYNLSDRFIKENKLWLVGSTEIVTMPNGEYHYNQMIYDFKVKRNVDVTYVSGIASPYLSPAERRFFGANKIATDEDLRKLADNPESFDPTIERDKQNRGRGPVVCYLCKRKGLLNILFYLLTFGLHITKECVLCGRWYHKKVKHNKG